MRTSLMIAAVLASATTAAAQDAAGTRGKLSRVGVVDLDRVGAESAMGKSLAKEIAALEGEIQAERTRKQDGLKRLDAEIATLQRDLDQQAPLLSEDGAEKKRQEIKRKTRDREAYVEDGRLQLERLTERAKNRAGALNGELRARMRPFLISVAREQGVDVLLDSRSAIAVDEALDISAAVIAALDKAPTATAAR